MSVLGGIEYSVEYIRVWNLLSRCRSCRKRRGNGVEKPEWNKKVRTVAPGGKIRAPKRESKDLLPCIFYCNHIHEADIEYYDFLRFEELQDGFEPVEDEGCNWKIK